MTNPEETATGQQAFQSGLSISTSEDIRHFIFEQLAEIRLCDVEVLEQEAMQSGGDLEIKSDEGVSITGGLEGVLGRDLAGPEDIDPKHFTSVNRLTELLYESKQKPPKRRSNRSSGR